MRKRTLRDAVEAQLANGALERHRVGDHDVGKIIGPRVTTPGAKAPAGETWDDILDRLWDGLHAPDNEPGALNLIQDQASDMVLAVRKAPFVQDAALPPVLRELLDAQLAEGLRCVEVARTDQELTKPSLAEIWAKPPGAATWLQIGFTPVV